MNTDFLIVNIGGHTPKGITDSNQLQLTKVTNWGEGLIQILLRQYSRKLNPYLNMRKLKYKNQIFCYYFGLTDYVLPKYVINYESVSSQLSIKPLRTPYE